MLLSTGVACAGAQSAEPRGVMAGTRATYAVVKILAHHHLQPWPLDDPLSGALFDWLTDRAGCESVRAALWGERTRLDDDLRVGDFRTTAYVAEQCWAPTRVSPREAEAIALDGLARVHDPHSAYLTHVALSARRARVHEPAEGLPRVRARVVVQDGVPLGVMRVPELYLRADHSTRGDASVLLARLREAGARALVLDLRGNGGGVESEAVALVGLLAGPGPVVWVVRRDGAELLRSDRAAAWDGPIAIAVDAMTASVAEVVAAALQDRAGALVLGQQTHGKGTGQTLVLLSSPLKGREGAVQVTDRRYHRIDGRPLQRQGVTPDLIIPAWHGDEQVVTERQRRGALRFGPIATRPMPRRPTPAPSPALSAARAWVQAGGLCGAAHQPCD